MTTSDTQGINPDGTRPVGVGRRGFLGYSAGAGLLAAGLTGQTASAQQANSAIDITAWSPEYVRSIAGTRFGAPGIVLWFRG